MKHVLFFIISVIVLMINSGTATELTNLTNTNEISIGIYILNIGKFDISTGSYTVDFYMSLKCSKKLPYPPPRTGNFSKTSYAP